MTTALIVGIAMGAFFAGVGTAWLIDWVYKRTLYREMKMFNRKALKLVEDWESRRGVIVNPSPKSDPPLRVPCVYCAPEGSIGRVSYIPCSDECRKKAEEE